MQIWSLTVQIYFFRGGLLPQMRQTVNDDCRTNKDAALICLLQARTATESSSDSNVFSHSCTVVCRLVEVTRLEKEATCSQAALTTGALVRLFVTWRQAEITHVKSSARFSDLKIMQIVFQTDVCCNLCMNFQQCSICSDGRAMPLFTR